MLLSVALVVAGAIIVWLQAGRASAATLHRDQLEREITRRLAYEEELRTERKDRRAADDRHLAGFSKTCNDFADRVSQMRQLGFEDGGGPRPVPTYWRDDIRDFVSKIEDDGGTAAWVAEQYRKNVPEDQIIAELDDSTIGEPLGDA